MTSSPSNHRPTIFISYATRDVAGRKKNWLNRLKLYLRPFQLEGHFEVFDGGSIPTGDDWLKAIKEAIDRCKVAVLLVGPHFLASDFIQTEELRLILQSRHAKILPLITGITNYTECDLGKFKSFNDPQHPLEALSRLEQEGWLRDFSVEIKRRVTAPPPSSPESGTPQVLNDLTEAIQAMGIIGGSARLEQSTFQPTQCFSRCNKSLFFLGNWGTKWVDEPRFEPFLFRMNALRQALPAEQRNTHGIVRFLLSDKTGNGLDCLKSFAKTYPCFQFKLYKQPPCFRLIFIDGMELGFAPYRFLNSGRFGARIGDDAPHIGIRADTNRPWSLYITFERYFEQLWSESYSPLRK